MIDRIEIRIAGFGGQGIIKAGVLLGSALAKNGLYVVGIPSYGPASRGGRCKCDLVVSSQEIDYPLVTRPDVLIAMSQEAYDAYIEEVKERGTVIYDPRLVHPELKKAINLHKIPATDEAERLGNRIVANMVMLGAFAAITRMLTVEMLEDAVKDAFSGSIAELNLRALRRGFELASGQTN